VSEGVRVRVRGRVRVRVRGCGRVRVRVRVRGRVRGHFEGRRGRFGFWLQMRRSVAREDRLGRLQQPGHEPRRS